MEAGQPNASPAEAPSNSGTAAATETAPVEEPTPTDKESYPDEGF